MIHFRSPSWLALLFLPLPALAQTPPFVTSMQMSEPEPYDAAEAALRTIPSAPALQKTGLSSRVKKEVKKGIQQAIDQSDPAVVQWRPLTPAQKFHVFVTHTYAPSTFAGAAIDAAADRIENHNPGYAPGFTGALQRYGVELTTSETEVFFGKFLIPTLLRQDPRYFRNPNLPFLKRVAYSLSRVVITRNDAGHQTFNASYVLGSAASQALKDLYVPGHQQGLQPIADRLTFDLAIDAGFNLLHEFWPDIRRKLFHR